MSGNLLFKKNSITLHKNNPITLKSGTYIIYIELGTLLNHFKRNEVTNTVTFFYETLS